MKTELKKAEALLTALYRVQVRINDLRKELKNKKLIKAAESARDSSLDLSESQSKMQDVIDELKKGL